MEASQTVSPIIWLVPSFVTLFLYGLGQGFVKKWSDDVPAAKFCLFLILARSLVSAGYFVYSQQTNPDIPDMMDPAGRQAMLMAILAYILDGMGWILYFWSILYGPITIVGTLSAAYPALTVLFARFFLNESLQNVQYIGVLLVIASCLGLSYSPPDPNSKVTSKRWIPLAFFALLSWGTAQTILKYAYGLPNASDANFALFSIGGGWLTLGVYGLIGTYLIGKQKKVREGKSSLGDFGRSFLPMGMMAGGDLGVIIATSTGPVSIVTPLTGAYPVVTLGFAALVLKEKISRLQWFCIATLLLGIILVPGFNTGEEGTETPPSQAVEQSPQAPLSPSPSQ